MVKLASLWSSDTKIITYNCDPNYLLVCNHIVNGVIMKMSWQSIYMVFTMQMLWCYNPKPQLYLHIELLVTMVMCHWAKKNCLISETYHACMTIHLPNQLMPGRPCYKFYEMSCTPLYTLMIHWYPIWVQMSCIPLDVSELRQIFDYLRITPSWHLKLHSSTVIDFQFQPWWAYPIPHICSPIHT